MYVVVWSADLRLDVSSEVMLIRLPAQVKLNNDGNWMVCLVIRIQH
jgi:hypothetical protein